MPDLCANCSEREPTTGLHPDVLAQLSGALVHLPEVYSKQRDIEEHAAHRSLIGRQNLNEALAHIGKLFQKADALNRDDQLAQTAHITDHLRRVVMENFEQEVNAIVGTIWDEGTVTFDESTQRGVGVIYDKKARRVRLILGRVDGDAGADDEELPRKGIGVIYRKKAAPLIRAGKINGVIHPQEVDRRFEAISAQVVEARDAKTAEGGWDVWRDAADDLRDASREAEALMREIGAAVDAALALRTQRMRWILGIVIGVAIAATRFL